MAVFRSKLSDAACRAPAPARYSPGEQPITERNAPANLLLLSYPNSLAISATVRADASSSRAARCIL